MTKLSQWRNQLLQETIINGMPEWVIEAQPVSTEVTEKTGYVRTDTILWLRADDN